ncbi:MAG: VapE family protein [Bacilli bacterium]|nr:VapE family protein [Bacilli bacterium]
MEQITIFNNLAGSPNLDIVWDDLITDIKSDTYKETIIELRKAKSNGDRQTYDKLKKSLQSFTYCSTYKAKRRKEYINSFQYIVGVDLDHVGDEERIKEICTLLKEDKHTFSFFISPSGDGIKIFYRLKKEEKVDKFLNDKNYDALAQYYAQKFEQVNKYVEEKYNVVGDPQVKDITRLCFVSYDPNAYLNFEAKPLDITNKELNLLYDETLITHPNQKGNRNISLYYFSQNAFSKGHDKAVVFDFCLDKYSDLDYDEIKTTFNSAYKSKKAGNREKSTKEKPKKTDEITNDQIRELFKKRFDIRNNIVTNCFEVLDKKDKNPKWKMYEEIICNTIQTYITDQLPIARKINVEKIMQTTEVKEYDPFIEKLNSLPAWDKKDHIGELASTIKTTNEDLWAKDLKKFMVAIVSSLLIEKAVNHYCLVITGKEGIGKTTWIKNLVPPEWQEHFTDSPLDLKHKDTNFKLSQNVLISIEELSRYTTNDINLIKELLTRASIQERVHFGKNQKKFPRRASFIATLNDKQFLSGEEGERRFWAHEALEIDYTKQINLDQVYAQALALQKEGFVYWETKEEIARRRLENSKYVQVSLTKELILKYFKLPSTKPSLLRVEKAEFYSCSDIMQDITYNISYSNKEITTVKIGKELSKLNPRTKMSNGIKRYLLVKKENYEIAKEKEVDFDEIENVV